MGCFGPDAPAARDYGQEMQDTLESQLKVMPDWYKSESTYRPKFAQLDADILSQTLPQLMDAYRTAAPVLSDVEAQAQQNRVGSEMQLLQQYGPEVVAALRGASGNTELMAELNRQAMSELASGASLDPAMQSAYQQSIRSAQAGRGMLNAGMPAISAEAALGAQTAEAMRRARQGFAGNVVGLNQATGGDPFMAILGRPSQTFSALQGYGGQAAGMNPGKVFNPESAYAGNLYGSNQAYDWQYKQATPSTMGKIGMVSDSVGSFLSSIGKGFMCWVAREVYGADDPRWETFREWLMLRAPGWFRALYRQHGERVAVWIADKPRVKSIIRWWMDGRIRTMEARWNESTEYVQL